MRYNFLTDSYEEEYSAFVTDFSKYEVINEEKKESINKKYTNFDDEEVVKEEEIKPTIKEEDIQGFVLEEFVEENPEENQRYILENEWQKELEEIKNTENFDKISAQLNQIDLKLGRICDYIQSIFNVK